jgi:glycosyltransferase involved in cell wall biosynthesis
MVADYPAPGAAPVGGPQVAVSRLVPELVRMGLEVIVVAPAPGSIDTERTKLAEGIEMIRMPTTTRWSLLRRLKPWRRQVVSEIQNLNPDLVHGQGLIPGGIAVADVDRVPRVVTARGNMRADTLAAYRGLGGISRAYVRDGLARKAVERADVVIGVNPDWTVNIPCRPRRFVYIPNIIDERFFGTERRPEAPLVLFTGGSLAIKGWPLLAEAWPEVQAAVPEARLLVVGWDREPPSKPVLGHGDPITFESWLSSEQLAVRMSKASLLVVASEFEVSPIVVAEAWAVGLPVVATPVGGLRSLVEGAGVVVSRRDPAGLARGVINALTGRRETIDQFVAEGRRRAEAHRAEAVVRAHVDLYNKLLGGR